LERVRDGEAVPLLLLGNKCDLADSRVISKESGQDRATSWGAMFAECSAKTGEGIHEGFVTLVRRILAEDEAKAAKMPVKRRHGQCTML
jgi:GTPase SAR1 family protein